MFVSSAFVRRSSPEALEPWVSWLDVTDGWLGADSKFSDLCSERVGAQVANVTLRLAALLVDVIS